MKYIYSSPDPNKKKQFCHTATETKIATETAFESLPSKLQDEIRHTLLHCPSVILGSL